MKNTLEDKDKIEQDKTESNLLPQAINLLANAVDIFKEHLLKKELSEKHEKKSHRLNSWGITIVTLVVSLIGISATMYQFSVENVLKRKFQYQQEVQTQIRQQVQFVETQIHDKVSKRDELNNAMSKIRNHIEISHLFCKEGRFSGDELQHSEKQIDNLYQMVNSVYSIYQIFDSNIQDQANYFLKLLDRNRSVCDKKEDFDTKLRLLQGQINKSMNYSIVLDKKKKKELLNKLANSPSWKE